MSYYEGQIDTRRIVVVVMLMMSRKDLSVFLGGSDIHKTYSCCGDDVDDVDDDYGHPATL